MSGFIWVVLQVFARAGPGDYPFIGADMCLHHRCFTPAEQYSSSETMAVTPVKFPISELTQALCGGVNKPEAWRLQHDVNSGAGNPR